MFKLAGCIILYNPNKEVWVNIKTVLKKLETLYVIDNSEQHNEDLCNKIKTCKKCRYINLQGNKGIAYALNVAVKQALNDNFEWLLTLDQDSCLSSENLHNMIKFISELQEDRVAMVGCNPRENVATRQNTVKSVEYVNALITSGTIMNTKICRKLGGFRTKLFIDCVDHEYCYRLRMNNYRIIRLNQIFMEHHQGNQKETIKGITWNYTPIRYYYIVRNNLFLIRKIKNEKSLRNEYKWRKRHLIKILRMVIREEKFVMKYIYIFQGIYDFCVNKYGRYEWR